MTSKMHRTRNQVFDGEKAKTPSGLKKSDLKKNKRGRVVSRRKSNAAKRSYDANAEMKLWTKWSKKNGVPKKGSDIVKARRYVKRELAS